MQSDLAWTLCWLVPLLLGGAVVPWLLWSIIRPRLRWPAPTPGRGPDSPPLGILWYSPACRDALGECGKLARLRRMSEQDIARLLFRSSLAEGEEYPTRNQYRTWPRQAELICAGHFDELRVYQAELIGDDSVKAAPVAENIAAHDDGTLKLKQDFNRIVFAVSALFLLLAVVIFALIHARGGCLYAGVPCKRPPDRIVKLKVQSEQLFAYAESKASLPSIQIVLDDWVETLRPYHSVKVKSIRAMTDPIGGAEYNASLAAQRGAAVRTLLEELADLNVKQPSKFPTFIDKSTIPAPTGTGADLEQMEIWLACKREFNDRLLPKIVQPLYSCPGKLTTKACVAAPSGDPPSAFGEFELASHSYDGQRRDTVPRQVIELMRNERKLIECLAPMRRVVVELQGLAAGEEPGRANDAVDRSTR